MLAKRTFVAIAAACALTISATAGETPAPEGAKVYFINLKDGAELTAPFKVQFGLSGMGIAPAGTEKEGTGHHHLLINEKLEGDELDEPIPSDDNHRHFGKGQTEVTLDLLSGTYEIQLVLGDQNHVPHNPPVMSERITITVK